MIDCHELFVQISCVWSLANGQTSPQSSPLTDGHCSRRILTFNMVNEAGMSLRCNSLGFLSFSERCTVWTWGKLPGMSASGMIGNCLKYFRVVNNLSHCRLMDFQIVWKWAYKSLLTDNCFSKIIADVFFLSLDFQHCSSSLLGFLLPWTMVSPIACE